MMENKSGRVASPNRLSSDDGAPSGLHPSGFDPARVLEQLTATQRRVLQALPFRAHGCGYQPATLRSLREQSWRTRERPPLADYCQESWEKFWFRTPEGEAVNALLIQGSGHG